MVLKSCNGSGTFVPGTLARAVLPVLLIPDAKILSPSSAPSALYFEDRNLARAVPVPCFCGECYQIVLMVVLECSVQYPRVPSSSSKGPAVIPYSAVLDPPQGFGRPTILMHLPWQWVISIGLWILSPWFACTFKWFGSWLLVTSVFFWYALQRQRHRPQVYPQT